MTRHVRLSSLMEATYSAELCLGSSAILLRIRSLHKRAWWRDEEMGGGVEGWMDRMRLTQTQEVAWLCGKCFSIIVLPHSLFLLLNLLFVRTLKREGHQGVRTNTPSAAKDVVTEKWAISLRWRGETFQFIRTLGSLCLVPWQWETQSESQRKQSNEPLIAAIHWGPVSF